MINSLKSLITITAFLTTLYCYHTRKFKKKMISSKFLVLAVFRFEGNVTKCTTVQLRTVSPHTHSNHMYTELLIVNL